MIDMVTRMFSALSELPPGAVAEIAATPRLQLAGHLPIESPGESMPGQGMANACQADGWLLHVDLWYSSMRCLGCRSGPMPAARKPCSISPFASAACKLIKWPSQNLQTAALEVQDTLHCASDHAACMALSESTITAHGSASASRGMQEPMAMQMAMILRMYLHSALLQVCSTMWENVRYNTRAWHLPARTLGWIPWPSSMTLGTRG